MSNGAASSRAIEQSMESTSVARKIDLAWEANHQGDPKRAYELSLEATESFPEAIEAWTLRARTAPSLEEKIICLNQVNTLDPTDSFAREETYKLLRLLLKKDSFLAYLDENEQIYHVHNGVNMLLAVPKERSIPERYPSSHPEPIRQAIHLLRLAVLGLFLAGVGTLIFAPLAAIKTLQVDHHTLTPSAHKRANILLVISILLCFFAIPLVGLFLLHIF